MADRRQWRSGGKRNPQWVLINGNGRTFFVRANSNRTYKVFENEIWVLEILWKWKKHRFIDQHTSLGGGVVNAFSSVICDASLTSSNSMTFFLAWFA